MLHFFFYSHFQNVNFLNCGSTMQSLIHEVMMHLTYDFDSTRLPQFLLYAKCKEAKLSFPEVNNTI